MVKEKIKNKGLKNSWLINQLGISKRTFYLRIKDDSWKDGEITILKRLGLLN